MARNPDILNAAAVARSAAHIHARRRWISASGWAVVVSLGFAALGVLGVQLTLGAGWWWLIPIGTVSVGLLLAAVLAARSKWELLQAAGELDRTHHTEGALRTALEIDDADGDAGLVAAARNRGNEVARDLDPASASEPASLSGWWWAVPAALSVAAAGLLAEPIRRGKASIDASPMVQRALDEIQTASADTAEVNPAALPQPEAWDEVFDEIEALEEELRSGGGGADAPVRAAAALDDAAEELDRQSEQAARDEQRLREQAQAFESARSAQQNSEASSLVDRLADALARNDLLDAEDAAREIDNAQGSMSDADRRELADVLEDFADRLDTPPMSDSLGEQPTSTESESMPESASSQQNSDQRDQRSDSQQSPPADSPSSPEQEEEQEQAAQEQESRNQERRSLPESLRDRADALRDQDRGEQAERSERPPETGEPDSVEGSESRTPSSSELTDPEQNPTQQSESEQDQSGQQQPADEQPQNGQQSERESNSSQGTSSEQSSEGTKQQQQETETTTNEQTGESDRQARQQSDSNAQGEEPKQGTQQQPAEQTQQGSEQQTSNQPDPNAAPESGDRGAAPSEQQPEQDPSQQPDPQETDPGQSQRESAEGQPSDRSEPGAQPAEGSAQEGEPGEARQDPSGSDDTGNSGGSGQPGGVEEAVRRLREQREARGQNQRVADSLRQRARDLVEDSPSEGGVDPVASEPASDSQRGVSDGTDRGREFDPADLSDPRRFEPVDASGPAEPGNESGRVVGDWFDPDRQELPSSQRQAAASELRRAARKARDAVDNQQVPRRYRDLVRRVFDRVERRAEEVGPAAQGQDATPSPAPSSGESGS